MSKNRDNVILACNLRVTFVQRDEPKVAVDFE